MLGRVCLGLLLTGAVSGLKLRTSLTLRNVGNVSDYTCSNVTRAFRNDTQIEFFTLNRQPNDPTWPILTAEVPQTYQEFMCGVVSRELPTNCTTRCAYLLKWQDPCMRTLNFTSVMYATDIIVMDKFKQVISIETRAIGENLPLTTSEDMMYILVVPKGSLTSVGLAATDPARIPPLPLITYQGGPVMAPAGLPGFHN